jgi:hypothetical protein
LPATIDIKAPSIGDGKGISIKVVLSSPSRPLHVHITIGNTKYIHDVVQAQLDQGTIKRNHPRDNVPRDSQLHIGEKGVSICYTGTLRGWLRVRYPDTETAWTKNVIIKPGVDDGNGTELVERAIAAKRSEESFEDLITGSPRPDLEVAAEVEGESEPEVDN